MQELGLGDMVLADAQTPREGERKGTWELYYTTSVNGVPIPGIREDRVFSDPAIGEDHQYWTYRCSEETNADTVSWYMESVWITVGRDGILSFEWDAPSTEPVVKETQTALMPFEDIASIANTMLPVVVIGPSEAHSIVEIDKINGDETYMDVEITKVSLSLMRVRDKGSLQGTIVPVWDFWRQRLGVHEKGRELCDPAHADPERHRRQRRQPDVWLLTVGRKEPGAVRNGLLPVIFCKGQDILEISVPKYLTDSSVNVPSASSSASA